MRSPLRPAVLFYPPEPSPFLPIADSSTDCDRPSGALPLNAPIVFLDGTITDDQTLLGALRPGVRLIRLHSHQDGIEQITATLAHFPARSIHILSHGTPGCLYLGTTRLTLTTLPHYAAHLQQWFRSPDPASDHSSDPIDAAPPIGALYLYGCAVAAGDDGLAFVHQIHHLTGAGVAASQTRTGQAALGGDWQLQVAIGSLPPFDPAQVFDLSQLATYAGVLEPETVVLNGSLELIGGSVNGLPGGLPETRLSTWFISNDLGTTGGPSGTADGSPGFGLGFLGGLGFSSPLDHGLVLFVNGVAVATPNNTVERDGNTITTGVTTLSGLNIQTRYQVDYARPILKSYVTFENPSDTAITVPVSWVSNFKPTDLAIEATSSGDATLAIGDTWAVADDGDWKATAIGLVFGGPDSPSVAPESFSQTVFAQEGQAGIRADYTITVPANSTRALLLFAVSGDRTDRVQETLNFVNASYDSQFTSLTPTERLQILNWNFGAGVILSATSGTTTEAGEAAAFTVKLSKQPTADVTVSFTSANPSEGTVSVPALTFTSDNWNTTQSITVTGVDDAIDDGDITYKIVTAFTSTDTTYTTSDPADILITNLDNDQPTSPPTPTPTPTPTPNPNPSPNPSPTPTPGNSIPEPPADQPADGKIDPPANAQLLRGGRRNDRLSGADANDVIVGLGGKDVLSGNGGDDLLNGGTDTDRLFGGAGRDTLVGGSGRDRFSGGANGDLFVLQAKQGLDRLLDFENGVDRIGLAGKLTFKQLTFERQGRNTLISNGEDELAIVLRTKPSAFTAVDFTRI